ncbi:hypothetical protein THAOC_28291, partial [Thalassiosira oceanica]
MSDTPVEDCCASCGKKACGAAKLKTCTACRLVKYCSVDCQRAHRKIHKKACRARAAELRDERLYGQGLERPEDDSCPICTLPIPVPMHENATFTNCCMKKVCHGCTWAVMMRGMHDTCAFCRTPNPKDGAAAIAMTRARVDARDPDAVHFLGDQYNHGDSGLEKDVPRAIELWKEAADLGSVDACYNLGNSYLDGSGVARDEARAVHYLEVAACRGHMGYEGSVKTVEDMYKAGQATKAQYEDALEGYLEATEEMKSPQREVAVYLRARSDELSRAHQTEVYGLEQDLSKNRRIGIEKVEPFCWICLPQPGRLSGTHRSAACVLAGSTRIADAALAC